MGNDNATLGRYQILDEIGRGSMGIVHRARDPLANRDIAIKTILSPHGVSAERWEKFHEQFRRQAEAAEGLSHQGIVAVYEVDDDPANGRPFIAMEFVAGPTLHELIRREGALNADWALSVADTLADALQAAQRAGVLHPDFKPANILVRESDGVTKIADFGVLHYSDSTQPGVTHGTPAYLAPECIEGQPADLRSELFTLAVILYEMLSGAPPFGGTVAGLVRESIVNFPHTRITERASDLAPGFDSFFERALAKRPADRFQDGASFRAALASLRSEQQRFREHGTTEPVGATGPPPGFETNAVPDAPAVRVPEAPSATRAASIPAPPKPVPQPAAQTARVQPPPLPRTAERTARSRTTAPARPAPRRSTLVSVLWSGAAIGLVILLAVSMVWVLRPRPASGPAPARSGAESAPGAMGHAAPLAPTPGRLAPLVAPAAAARPTEPAVALPRPSTPHPAAAPKPEAARKPSAERLKADPTAPLAPAKVDPSQPTAGLALSPSVAEPVEPPPAIAAVRTARLALFVKSSLKEGTLTLQADGQKVYSTDLVNGTKKWKKVIGRAHQDFEAQVDVPAGTRTITAHVLNTAKSREYEATIEVKLVAGEERGLQIVAGRTIGPPLTLTLD